MKIGIITDCMKRKTLTDALRDAAALGADGVQIYATEGEFCPQNLGAEKKEELRALLCELGLEVSALCGDMGGYGFEREEDNADRVEKTKAIIDLAKEFGAKAVTTHIGVIPESPDHPRYAVMLAALSECGRYAAARGVTLAIETGPEKAATLKGFLDRTEGGVGVNLDPANFTMVTGQDAVEAVYLLADYIVHTHAKDGRKLDPDQKAEDVYHAFAVGGVEAINACEGFVELPLGEGDVDWKRYIAALREIGYDGYLTIEREAGEKPFEDIAAAVKFLEERTGKARG